MVLRYFVLIFILAFIVGWLVGSINKENELGPVISEFKARQEVRDSIIKSYQFQIDSLTIQRDTIRDNILVDKIKVDNTVRALGKLTKPEITDEDVKEALRWIDLYGK